MPVVAAAGAVVAPPATAPTTKATTTTHQCPRNTLERSSHTGASRSPPTALATSPTKASSSPTTRASTATMAPRRASRRAIIMDKATTPPTQTPTAPPGAGADQTTATRANSVSWLPGPQGLAGVQASGASHGVAEARPCPDLLLRDWKEAGRALGKSWRQSSPGPGPCRSLPVAFSKGGSSGDLCAKEACRLRLGHKGGVRESGPAAVR